MERPIRTMSQLFTQLGCPSDAPTIARFIETRRPLANGLQLHEAGFWNAAQAAFLREAILDDADWAEVADELNAELHARH